jgi:hypothetical protein
MLADPAHWFRQVVSDEERPADDYRELLHRGHVSSLDGVNSEARPGRAARAGAPRQVPVLTVCDRERPSHTYGACYL